MTERVDRVEMERMAAARRSHLLAAAIAAVVTASLGLSTAFQTYDWFPLSFVAVLLAFGVGRATRRLDVPGILAPAVSVLAFVVLLGLVYYRDTTMLGIPSGLTLHSFGESIREALEDIRVLVAPVEATESLTILTGCGVFFVAVVVDYLVFGARRPVLAGLPLLALYVIPASLRDDGVGALTFAIAAAGYVTLLIAEGRERAKGWGRRLAGRGVVEELVDVSPVSRVGRRLGAAAVSLAIVVPVFVPDLGDGLIGGVGTGGGGFGDGPSSREVVNPIVELKRQLRDDPVVNLFRVRTTQPEYLRLTSLDAFDGNRWWQSPLTASSKQRVDEKTLPAAPGLSAGIPVDEIRAELEIFGLDVPWLPAPYAPHRVDVDRGDWRYDAEGRTVFSSRASTRQMEYSVEARVARPTPEQLSRPRPDQGDLDKYLAVPDRLPDVVHSTLAAVTAGIVTPYDRMMALQEFFRDEDEFTYTLSVPRGSSSNHLATFLTPGPEGRRGYCEQFAAAMALLARLDGMPARVAIGFTPGRDLGGGEYIVTNRDAHAWPEIYFAEVGWVRFEPTPRSDNPWTRPPAYATPASTTPDGGENPQGEATPTPSSAPAPTSSATGLPRGDRESLEPEAPSAGGPGSAGGGIGWWMALYVALAAVVVATPALLRLVQRSLRRRRAVSPVDHANAAWCDLADDAEDLGYAMRGSDSPRAAARRLAGDASLQGAPLEALTALSRAEERARYASSPDAADGLAERVRTVRRALLDTVPPGRRLRALLLPASTLRRVRRSLSLAGQRGSAVLAAGSGRVAAALPPAAAATPPDAVTA